VSAGFFLYDIPPGKVVASVIAQNGAHPEGTDTWYSV
jgi:hypothetical protein